MIKTNKIIRKRLLPGTIIVGIAVPAMFGAFGYMFYDETKDAPIKDDVELALLSAGMAIACSCFLLLPVIETYKDDYAFASHTAREFLKQEMKEHPELKNFEKVLRNPRAIRSVATMISNHLHPSEQKLVMAAIDGMLETETKTTAEKVAAVKTAHAKIVKIVQEHAAVYPEFSNEILAAMAYADTTYVIPVQQHTK